MLFCTLQLPDSVHIYPRDPAANTWAVHPWTSHLLHIYVFIWWLEFVLLCLLLGWASGSGLMLWLH